MTEEAAAKTFEPTTTHTSDLASVVSDAWQEISDLGAEFREIYDNASDNLKNSEVNQTRNNTADAVEGLSEPDVSSSVLGELDVTYTEDNGKVYRGRQNQSRACRAANAAAKFRAAAEAISTWLGEHDEIDEADQNDPESLRERAAAIENLGDINIDDYNSAREEAESLPGDLESIADEIDGMEWPGMFG